MYYWPMFSAIVGIGGNFLFLVVTSGLIWFYESTKTSRYAANPVQSQNFIQILRNRRNGNLFSFKNQNDCYVSHSLKGKLHCGVILMK